LIFLRKLGRPVGPGRADLNGRCAYGSTRSRFGIGSETADRCPTYVAGVLGLSSWRTSAFSSARRDTIRSNLSRSVIAT
jgi:hypothetical protein